VCSSRVCMYGAFARHPSIHGWHHWLLRLSLIHEQHESL
jgi:hypothetical protein